MIFNKLVSRNFYPDQQKHEKSVIINNIHLLMESKAMKIHRFLHCFLFLALILFFSVQAGSAEQQPPSIGQIVWVKGEVKAITANQAVRTLQRRSPIFTKDTIVTDKASTGEVVFTDNSVVSLQQDTQLRIDEYQFGKNVEPGKAKYVASLIKGGFRTITGLIPKENANNYQVNTPVATIAVQGTHYVAIYRGQLFLKYLSGAPCMRNSKGTVCLNANLPYAEAASGGGPVGTTKEPSVFKDITIELTPASFDPTASPTNPNGTGTKGGVVGSFCIG